MPGAARTTTSKEPPARPLALHPAVRGRDLRMRGELGGVRSRALAMPASSSNATTSPGSSFRAPPR
jgi:hypothetical protein